MPVYFYTSTNKLPVYFIDAGIVIRGVSVDRDAISSHEGVGREPVSISIIVIGREWRESPRESAR